MAQPIEMPLGWGLGWAQGSMCYMGCTLAPPLMYLVSVSIM